MSKRLLPIRVRHIERRETYYLYCGKCGLADLQDDDYPTRVANRATNIGWRYDSKDKCVLCPACVMAIPKEEMNVIDD